MKREIICGEAVEHLVNKMQKDGAPEEAITQMLSMLLEMSTRLLYNEDITVQPEGLTCATAKGKMELNFSKPQDEA